jgi:hypothetical protein
MGTDIKHAWFNGLINPDLMILSLVTTVIASIPR